MPYKDKNIQREYQRLNAAKRRLEVKAKVLDMYGGACARCKNNDSRVLQLDHIVEIRRTTKYNLDGLAGTPLWYKVARGIYPKEDFQLLCANCHAIKTYEALHM
jgi:5-methylcytosine-specific restriction endonuclease McrA